MMTRRPPGLIRRRGRSRSRFLLRECFVVESREWWWCRLFVECSYTWRGAKTARAKTARASRCICCFSKLPSTRPTLPW